ncbi:MAG: hypothetical protein JWQ40_814 [Segetibacter sp.]|nr:hypothetical protein [Segetibacter sp.]
MSDDNKSAWEKLAEQVTSPWDWVFIGLGSAVGAGVTLVTHGTDLGTSIAAGASTGFTLRKAGSASFKKSFSIKKARNLKRVLHDKGYDNEAKSLEEHIFLFRNGLFTQDEFEQTLTKFTDRIKREIDFTSIDRFASPTLLPLEDD